MGISGHGFDGLCWLGNPPVSTTLELLLEEPVHRIVRQTDAPARFSRCSWLSRSLCLGSRGPNESTVGNDGRV